MTHHVVFLVFDGMKMLDVTGPAEVLAEANRFGADYRLTYASVSGGPVTTSIWASFAVDRAAADVASADTVIVSGGDGLPTEPIAADLLAATRKLHARTRRTVSICTGSFVLAAAGLLDGRRATTHWRHAELLARAFPGVEVVPDALFVRDADVHTSAGVSAGMDLALALVEDDHGADLARDVARNLVMFMQRAGGQSQFAAPLEQRAPRVPELRSVVDLVAAEPAGQHTVRSLAEHVRVSPRHLSQLFISELGTTPARFVEGVRLAHAQGHLDLGHSVGDAARLAGFGSAETMRRVFVARLGVAPSVYRDRFATTGRDAVTPATRSAR